MRYALITAFLVAAPLGAAAHGLNVFASADCETVTVEAKFSNGKVAQKGDVRVLDGENALQQTLSLATDGTAKIDLEAVNHSTGLVIEVDTGGHDNYWILTPEDIAKTCTN